MTIVTRGVPLMLVAIACADAVASPVSPGQLTVRTTTQSIGLEWPVTGDTDHDASASVEYRAVGAASWNPATNLVRIDSAVGNSLAGSIMFLNPGASYDVRVTLTDPDGGNDSRTVVATTASTPVRPTPTRTLHVVPGSGGGTGSAADPYRGLAAAWAQAQPGDELLLHAGSYGGVNDSNGRSGTAAQPIVLRAAGDGDVVFSYIQLFLRSYLWFEGLTFRHDGSSDTGFYSSLLNAGYDTGFQPMQATITNVVLTRNRFEGYKHSIRLGPRTNRWFITDNTLIGDKQLGATGTLRLDGEGVELGHGSNHEVAFNSITLHADGVSFPEENCDIYGNDIWNMTDDGLELDGGQANTRVWQNRIHNASNNGIAFQPQAGAPWYLIRNQIINAQESIFKFREGDRFFAAHNTFVNWGAVIDHWAYQLFNGITRNNLWISANNGPIWSRGDAGMTWRTDFDYDGFDWGTNGQPFDVNNTKYSSLDALRNATGEESHGIRINARTCLESFNVPGPPPLTTIPPQLLTLRSTCNAVDAGVVLPNLGGAYLGAAPDIGAYELGAAPPHYGVRSGVRPMPPTGVSVQ